ncbi:MAG: hypothetical protein GY760_15665 [Deltaproteobacteria bacterium]|nr:hypothetical protein [Deltaproteobacteria bacterium]
MKLGFDFGSKNINCVVLEGEEILFKDTISHNGDITGVFKDLSSKISSKFKGSEIKTYGITGSVDFPNIEVFDPVIASVEANKFFKTDCKNILSIGCETFYLILLDDELNYIEHFVNSDCASGTGGFIDQQAERLGFSTAELSSKASLFQGNTPSIATRCAVFAKSDIIHAQAHGYTKDAISAGLCEGIARSVLANTVKGRKISGDFLFTGGMSKNNKVIEEIEKNLGNVVKVPELSSYFNAIGAALLGKSIDFERDMLSSIKQDREMREELSINLKDYPDFSSDTQYEEDGIEITIYKEINDQVSVYIGIDVGSTSTKSVVMDKEGEILSGLYGRTKGDPVKAVTTLLKQIRNIYKDNLSIIGVSTTGSGRELVKEVTGADLSVNEITAHAKGATFLDSDVDTIIEIGGQDSKFTTLKDGDVTNATMNYVCAAGTGSFIEEQAKRLNITLDEISEMAGGELAPYTSDRCTVYMERDLNIFLSEGFEKEQIIASVLYSVRDNYLSKVVGKTSLGNKIFFQGATARNKALVAVFENEIGKPIHVSKFCHLTGAVGCAVTLKEKGYSSSEFKGIGFKCDAFTESCDLCSNMCELRVYNVDGKKTAWGLKCGRDYDDKKIGTKKRTSEFLKRYETVFSVKNVESFDIKVGIPEAVYMAEYTPLFKDFFRQLNIKVVIEKSSDKKLETGVKMVNSDFCAPIALAHGLVESLARKNVDYIFFPTIINEQNHLKKHSEEELYVDKLTDSYFCYYSAYTATIIDNLPGFNIKEKFISPKIKFNNLSDETVADNLAKDLNKTLKVDTEVIKTAFIESLSRFRERKKMWIDEGSKILSSDNEKDKMKILLLGRPYAIFDKRINLGIPDRLEEMGFEILNQTMLDLYSEKERPDHIENMHWYYGQQILLATETAIREKDIYPIFLTCFRCSPDSYLMTYFKETMEKAGKPFLVMQLDEHSSDVGYMTRIEASIDSFKNHFEKKPDAISISRKKYVSDEPIGGDMILIPTTDPRMNLFQKYVFEAAGYKSKVLGIDQKIINLGYRYASGGECLPNISITGSVIEAIKNQYIDPKKACVYLPNLCLSCNFNQYSNLIKLGCKNAGLDGIKVLNFNGTQTVPGISGRDNSQLLAVTIMSSILHKLEFRYRPYEKTSGETQKLIEQAEKIVIKRISERKSILMAANEVRDLFETIKLPVYRKPKIGILGDMYAKYNPVLNDSLCDYAESLGGEIILPSYNELVIHTIHADTVENGNDTKLLDTMVKFEQKFEKVFEGILDDVFEPDLDECYELMKEFGIKNFITGETAISVGRLLYYVKHNVVDAVIHVNPVFCCPGVISSSIFRNIQDEFKIPIVDLFYDGTNKPNKIIVPHMFYLGRSA